MKKKRKQVQCLVRGNKVFFYGKAAKLVSAGIKASGLTPTQFLDRAIRNAIAYRGLSSKTK